MEFEATELRGRTGKKIRKNRETCLEGVEDNKRDNADRRREVEKRQKRHEIRVRSRGDRLEERTTSYNRDGGVGGGGGGGGEGGRAGESVARRGPGQS